MSTSPGHLVSSGEYDALEPQEAIIRLQSEVARAKTYLSALEWELERQRGRVYPIQKLNSDVLQYLFEWSNMKDWKSPLRIAGTCRRWRNVVHNTPEAWSLIRLQEFPPMEIFLLYIARSGMLPLHIATPATSIDLNDAHYGSNLRNSYLKIIIRNSHRIECLTISSHELSRLTGVFPILQRLSVIAEPSVGARLKDISASNFPQLRYLYCQEFAPFHPRVSPLPPTAPNITQLDIRTDENLGWIKIIQLVAGTLISLRIFIPLEDQKELLNMRPTILPALQFLDVHCRNRSIPWHFKAKTPSLRSYRLVNPTNRAKICTVEVDLAFVTHLRLSGDHSLEQLSLLRYLFIGHSPKRVIALLEANPFLCPLLEKIEYSDHAHGSYNKTVSHLVTRRVVKEMVREIPVTCTTWDGWSIEADANLERCKQWMGCSPQNTAR